MPEQLNTRGGWFKCDRVTWDKMADAMTGPWPRECVLADLARWSAGAAVGDVRPSQSGLADRWGWSRSRVRTIIARQSPTVSQAIARQSPGAVDESAIVAAESPGNRQAIANPSPGVSQPPSGDAQQALIVESPERERETERETHLATARHSAGKRQAEQDGRAKAVWEHWKAAKTPDGKQPHRRARKTTTGQLKHINARLADGYTVEELTRVIDYHHEDPAASYWRGDNPRGTAYLGIESLLKPDKFTNRLEAAHSSGGGSAGWAKVLELSTMQPHQAREAHPGTDDAARSIRSAAVEISKMNDHQQRAQAPRVRALLERRLAAGRFDL